MLHAALSPLAQLNRSTMSWKFRIVNTAIMSFFLSGLMTIYVTFINLGLVDDFIAQWVKAWTLAAPAAFVCVMILMMPVQRVTKKLLGQR